MTVIAPLADNLPTLPDDVRGGPNTVDFIECIAMLVAGEINHHIVRCGNDGITDDDCDGCCPICCAPCKAMAWFRDNANEMLTAAFKAWDDRNAAEMGHVRTPEDEPSWMWQLPDGSVNWAMIETHWKLTECHQE